MIKTKVIERRVSAYVIKPDTILTSFSKWWLSLDPTTAVPVRFPHGRHGNAGKPSYNAKTTVRDEFIELVANNI